jgi:hypothetical protein
MFNRIKMGIYYTHVLNHHYLCIQGALNIRHFDICRFSFTSLLNCYPNFNICHLPFQVFICLHQTEEKERVTMCRKPRANLWLVKGFWNCSLQHFLKRALAIHFEKR